MVGVGVEIWTGVVALRFETEKQNLRRFERNSLLTESFGFCNPSIQHRASFPPSWPSMVAPKKPRHWAKISAIGKVLRTKAGVPTSQRHDVTSHHWLDSALARRDLGWDLESRNRFL